MTPSDFAAWVAAMKAARDWKQKDCAAALGVVPGQIGRWKERGAPHYIALACAAVVADIAPWDRMLRP